MKRMYYLISSNIAFTIYLILLFGSFQTAQAQQNSATIRGKILKENGLPLPFANVHLKDNNKGALTDEEGLFTIEQVSAGKYLLTISHLGYTTKEMQIRLENGQELTVPDIRLLENGSDLSEFTITDRRINEYANKETDYVARMPLSNLENPQVYSVIHKELIQEQVLVDIDQTVRNSPGVVPIKFPSGGFGVTFRGFSVGVNARNGMETISGRTSLDIANVERIEVLKGPSAVLFGNNVSSFGGVVNLVTKKPMDTKNVEVSYTTGSFNLNRITADLNTPLNEEKTLLFRLNTALHKEKSFLNYGFNNSFLIAPSLVYKASERLTFTIDTELFNANSTRPMYSRYAPNSGITSPKDVQLDYRTTLYHENADAQTSATKIFVEANYQLAKNWSSTTLLSFVGEEIDRSYQYYPTWLSPTIAARGIGNWADIYSNATNIQQNINGEFSTGRIKHKVLIGVNGRHTNQNRVTGSTVQIDTVDISTQFNPLIKSEIDPNLIYRNGVFADELTLSAYVTDVVQFTDRLSTLLSLRVDHYNRAEIATVEGFQQTALAPNIGIVYQVVKDQVSVFGNYMSGFQNQAPRNQPDGAIMVIDPVFAIQSEAGVKVEAWDKKLSTTLSYYDITIDNAIRINSDGFAIQDGVQVSKGLELEAITSPIQGLNIIAGYAYNDNRIIKATDESIEGNKATDSPEHVANFWASYTFQHNLKGLGFGVGGNHVSESYMFADNVFTVPSYTVFNASVFYNQANWRLGLKLNNLTNERYWAMWGVPQAPRNFAANLTIRL